MHSAGMASLFCLNAMCALRLTCKCALSRGAARVSLLTRDPDAPTPSEVEYAHKMIEHQMDIHSGKKQHAGKGRLQQAFMVPQTQLEKQNIVLKKRVCPRHIAVLAAQRASHSKKMHGTHCRCARCQSKTSVGWALN
jgi:hypothetical protein